MNRTMLRLSEDQFAARQAKAAAKPIPAPVSAPKPAKYRNRPTGGYSSAKEARRAAELKLMERAGTIRNLREQVPFELIPQQGKERACKYIADFVYDEENEYAYRAKDGYRPMRHVVEDVKSPASRTAEYIIKRKLMLQVFGVRIRET